MKTDKTMVMKTDNIKAEQARNQEGRREVEAFLAKCFVPHRKNDVGQGLKLLNMV